jgi:C_GCAxxG_C_C family probable redox protein
MRDAVDEVRRLYLDDGHAHGCAEATFVALKGALGLPAPADASAAMALNGGIAYSGGTCGAITGSALAIGLLAASRIDDHRAAKATARRIVARLMDDFEAAHGALDCRTLTGHRLRTPAEHDAFIASGVWRDGCMRQLEFVVARLAPLADPTTWAETVAALEASEG